MRKHTIACLTFVVLCALIHPPVSGATLFGLVNTGELFASTDNGATWAVHSTTPVSDAVAIAAGESSDELFMATRSGLIFRSIDAGLNWSAIGAVSASDVVAMAIRSNGDIYLLSERGSLWRSTDDGATFTPLATLTASNHMGLTLDVKGDVLYAVTRTGEVSKSTDLGITWNVVGVVTTSDAVAIRFAEPYLYVLTGTGGVGKSTDQGATWMMVGTISQVHMVDLTTNGTDLVAATEEGLVATSGDATNWSFAGSINQLKVVAIGNDIPTTTNVSDWAPSFSGLRIRSLWPNPAGESTTLVTIGFELAESDRVGYHVFDVAGRLVGSSAQKEFVTGGSHKLQWNVGDIPSGVYFLKLVTERGLTAPAKLTLVR